MEMLKVIQDNYKNTDDAVLMQKVFGYTNGSLGIPIYLVEKMLEKFVAENKEELLAEAKRIDAENNKSR